MATNTTATQSEGSSFEFYHYHPTEVGAVAFVLLFIASTCLHVFQSVRVRCWFVIPLIFGGIFEAIGYAGRFLSGRQTPNWTLGPYIIQSLFLLVAPSLFAATIYMALGRIILLVDGESRAIVRKKWLTKIFVCGDVLSFLLQGGGGGYQSSGTLAALETGSHIIVVGLFVQLVFFGFFIIVAIAFNITIIRRPTARSSGGYPWEKHMKILYITSFFVMVRSVFRVVEYLQGFDGYILRHEVYLYIFDAVLMFLVMVLFNVVHPREISLLMANGKAGDDEIIMSGV